MCGKHSGQREASKWELRVSLTYNGRERGLRGLQLCHVWKLGRGGGEVVTGMGTRPVRLR